MAYYRTATLHPLGQLRQELDRILNDFTRGGRATNTPDSFPAVNMWESGSDLFVEAELPGLKQEDLEVFVSGNELTIKGNRKESEPAEGSVHRRERGTGAFNRNVRLPVEVDSTKVEANLRNGVLGIKLPKAEAAKPRKIKVQLAHN